MSIRGNVVANLIGRLWSSLMSFAFVPFYIKFLGIEAYGLIGFFVSLLAVFFVLDMGLSTSINRELARLEARQDGRLDARNLVRTLELIYWATGLGIGVIIVALAPWIAHNWLNARHLSVSEVTAAIRLMGVVAVLRWPVPLYTGGLMGLQRQVMLNVITGTIATLQGGGAILVLWLVKPSISVFFVWQVVASAIQMALLPFVFWSQVPLRGHWPSFSKTALRSIWGFSAGVTGITIVSVVLTQLDKFLVSKFLPLESFGYYALAGSIAGVLNLAAMSVYGALFPAFSQLIASDRTEALRVLYHKGCQLLSLVLFPVGVALAFFARELLSFYVRNQAVVEHTHTVLSLLVIGNMGLSIMLLPLALQLGYGWTTLSLYKNIVAVILFVPAMYLMVMRYGTIGAALVWIALTMGYVLIEIPLMHRRILEGEQKQWYLVDVGVPLAISIAVLGILRLSLPANTTLLVAIPAIGLAVLSASLLSTAALPTTRAWCTSFVRLRRVKT